MSDETYVCAMCHEEFIKGWSDEEAHKEAENNGFIGLPCELVCDDCWKLTPWGKEDQETVQ